MSQQILVPTLMYHCVDDEIKAKNIVTRQRFAEQLAALIDSGYKTITLEHYVEIVRNKIPPQEKSILLTFDDGYEDFYINAWPILQKFDAKAVVFLVTEYIGQLNWWNHKVPYFKRHLSWSQVADLKEKGISFGGHSTAHHNLAKFDADYIRQDLVVNKSAIEQQIGSPIQAFCYPYGDYTEAAQSVVRELFSVAFSVNQGSLDYHIDRYAINRFAADHPKYDAGHLIEVLDEFTYSSSVAGDESVIIRKQP